MAEIEVQVNRDTCQGYGNCVLVAPELFDLDDEGLATLRVARVGVEAVEDVRKAAYDCPTASISYVEEADAAQT